jgi:hypothetical protein
MTYRSPENHGNSENLGNWQTAVQLVDYWLSNDDTNPEKG